MKIEIPDALITAPPLVSGPEKKQRGGQLMGIGLIIVTKFLRRPIYSGNYYHDHSPNFASPNSVEGPS